MDYTVLHIAVSDDEQAEILTAELADFPFWNRNPQCGPYASSGAR